MEHSLPTDQLPPDGEKVDITRLSRVLGVLPLIAITGGVLSVGMFFFPATQQEFAYSWLFGFYFFFTISVGALFWTMLHHATNSGWGVVVRRVMELVANLLPVLFLLALPVVLNSNARESLYEWLKLLSEAKQELGTRNLLASSEPVPISSGSVAGTEKSELGGDASEGSGGLANTAPISSKVTIKDLLLEKHYTLLAHKLPYLNLEMWLVRFFVVGLVLCGGSFLFLRMSVRQDKIGGVRTTFVMRRFSCGFIIFFALSITFMGFDLLMGLDYKWFSTMWGVYIFAGSALAGMAVIILTVSGLRNIGYLRNVVTEEHYHLMGKLLFSFTVFWAYISFSQFFLYWYANITEETTFFLLRNTDGWFLLSIFIVLGHFVVPFLFLLRRSAKKDFRQINAACSWLLFVHLLDLYWVIIPERGPSLSGTLMSPAWAILLDLLALITIGSILLYIFLRNIGKHSIYPCRDPRLLESISVTN